ncbi:murein biosynthesis integral membrane protein MurJ [Patescibacteria group bacterium]|nr:murein biosynthesis integral membrane protein MurJ [Patescibacteria group bacterium]
MVKVFWHKLITTVTGGAVLIATFSVVSKILGLVRDRLLASYFGAGDILDSYYAAFRLPDLIFNTLVLGALASAFIPVFTKLWFKNKEEALKLSNAVLNYLVMFLVLVGIAVFVLAPQIVAVITPGFSGAKLVQTINLTRIMLISIVFFGISNVIGGILNSLKRFLSFSLAPVFYNLGIVFGITVFYKLYGVAGLAWGVVLGSVLHLLIQLPEVLISGWKYHWSFKATAEVKKVLKLMVPRTVGLAGNQINQIVITIIASTLAAGSVAIFNLANNLQSFPISIFGVSLAIAAFPVFSEALGLGDREGFKKIFSVHFRRILFLIIPVSVFILLLRAQIVRVILGAGNFDWSDTYYTAQALGWFIISLFAQSTIPMLARSFYALEDTKTPVIISLAAMVVNIAGSYFLGARMGVEGLALAFSIASILNMIALTMALRLRLGYLDDKKIIWSTFKISLNSLIAGAGVYFMLRVMADLVNMRTFAGVFIQGLAAGIVGIVIYLIISFFTNCEEIVMVKRFFQKHLEPIIKKS